MKNNWIIATFKVVVILVGLACLTIFLLNPYIYSDAAHYLAENNTIENWKAVGLYSQEINTAIFTRHLNYHYIYGIIICVLLYVLLLQYSKKGSK